MVMLEIHGCVHMLCTQHGRLLSAQTQSKMVLLMDRKISHVKGPIMARGGE